MLDDVLYAGAGSTLSAYDATGRQGCSTAPGPLPFLPITCDPLWQGTMTAEVASTATPAVANGFVYQSAQDGRLNVFAKAGCGTAMCAPSWTAPTGVTLHATPAVTQTAAFVVSGSTLYAFKASGCGAAACTPLWTAPLGASSQAAPSVAGDVLYIGTDDGHIESFDARGCGHKTCSVLWSAQTGGAVEKAPAISNGRVFVADAAGTLHSYGLPTN